MTPKLFDWLDTLQPMKPCRRIDVRPVRLDPTLWDSKKPTRKQSRTTQVVAFFKARPNEWVDGLRISDFAGVYGWRSRISDARKRGLTIHNRQRHLKNGSVVSEYCYEPGGHHE
jgi:hypothetical protein